MANWFCRNRILGTGRLFSMVMITVGAASSPFHALPLSSLRPAEQAGGTVEEPQVNQTPEGLEATDEEGGQWINFIGATPTLSNLKGRCVVLLFFDQEALRAGVNWGLIQAQVVQFKGKVQFLGLYSGSHEDALGIAERFNLFFPIGTDTAFREQLGIAQNGYEVLLDRDGGVFWHGPLGGLWDAKIQKGARGAANVFAEGALFVFPEQDYRGRLARIAKKLRQGHLEDAYRSLQKLRADSKASAAEQAQGEELSQLLGGHVDRLAEQIETEISRREALRAQTALEVIEKELRRTPLGAWFKTRLAELKEDQDFQRELAADKEFSDLYRAFWTRPPSKWRKKITYFLDKHEGTRAAQKARVLSTL